MDRINYIERLKDQLHATDYIAIKSSEGIDCSKYGDWKQDRQKIRDEIDLIEHMSDEEFQETYKDIE